MAQRGDAAARAELRQLRRNVGPLRYLLLWFTELDDERVWDDGIPLAIGSEKMRAFFENRDRRVAPIEFECLSVLDRIKRVALITLVKAQRKRDTKKTQEKHEQATIGKSARVRRSRTP